MNLTEIFKWSLKHWWWFVISVGVCTILGGAYFFFCTPEFKVNATLMLRQVSDRGNGQDEMMQMMGFGEEKLTGDEVKVLTSRDLLGRVVDELNLYSRYWNKTSRGWREQYLDCPISVEMPVQYAFKVKVKVVVKNGQRTVTVKADKQKKEQFKIKETPQTLHTQAGAIIITIPDSITEGRFRAELQPRIVVIDNLFQTIKVNRLSRESNVITLSTVTTCPSRSIAIINTLLEFYNQESATDKNLLAVQTELFLTERIAVVERELNETELTVETYKRAQQIADLEKTAEKYQQLGDNFEQQVAQIDADIHVLDYIAEQISKPENAYAMIPWKIGVEGANINVLVQDYNERIAHRASLLQSATEDNPLVVQETQILNKKRQSIQDGIAKSRQTLTLRRLTMLNQQNQYTSRLASLPQTERRYVELNREKETKEKQYLYLIQKREENAMLLASKAVPARIVEKAQLDPNPTQPKLKLTGVVALLMGLIIPLLFYFAERFRKEWL